MISSRSLAAGAAILLLVLLAAPQTASAQFQALKTSVNGPTKLAYDGNGALYIVEWMQKRLLKLTLGQGSIKVVALGSGTRQPQSIAMGPKGRLFIADFDGRLSVLDTGTGRVTALLSKPFQPLFAPPEGMTLDSKGNLLMIANGHELFRWNSADSRLETVAGTGIPGFAGDGGLAVNARFQFPMGVAVNRHGDIFVADYQNCRIRRIDFATTVITTIAGTGECSTSGDGGLASKASLNYPDQIAVDSSGNLFFTEGSRVRRIDSQGIVTTYAGTGQQGFGGDGGPADQALLNNPSGLAVDELGNLFISDFVANRIRRVDALTHVITTIAGDGNPHRTDVLL